MDFITSLDFKILDFIRENLTNPAFDFIMPLISLLGNAAAVWIIVALILMNPKKHRKSGITMAVALIFCLILGNLILKPLIARVRPYDVRTTIELLITAPIDFSFPSGHTLSAFAMATVLMFTEKKLGICALILAFLIAFSRLYLYLHYPSDVLAGMILGVLLGFAAIKTVELKWKKPLKGK